VTERERIVRLLAAFASAAPMLQRALDRGQGQFTLGDIKDRVMEGELQLWHGEGYAAVTEVLNYPQRRVVLVHLAGGDLAPLVEAEGDLVKFARAVEATGIEIIGRKGWVKALRDRGYQETAVHLFKEV